MVAMSVPMVAMNIPMVAMNVRFLPQRSEVINVLHKQS